MSPFNPSPQQQAVISHRGGHLQVIACAGSGKTESIARRVAGLLAEGATPESIEVFTCTHRAAAKAPLWHSGILYPEWFRTDLLAFTERNVLGFLSPSTMCDDYAISHDLIHRQSQSIPSSTRPTGKR